MVHKCSSLLGRLVKGCSPTQRFSLRTYSEQGNYYDLVVIGGGSGGLACSKEAAELGKRVAVLDYVEPSTQGTTWGLGGTCVNVGCIPKKLMHQGAIVGHHLKEAASYGWTTPDTVSHDWSILVENVTNHIKSLNFGHRVALMDKNVDYLNAKGTLIDANTVMTVNKKQKKEVLNADKIVLATGLRPKLLSEVPGMTEHAITSDDLFSMSKPPGKTLVIGGSYVALECAGFLAGLGYDTTVMLRSIPLRGFDQQMAELLLAHLEASGVEVLRGCTPHSVTRIGNSKLSVGWSEGEDEYDTVLAAVGREPRLHEAGVADVGVELHSTSGRVIGGHGADLERSSVSNIYAVGDILHGRPELTPVAIKAGKLLARRLFGGSGVQMDYNMVPTTVFTPLEYSSVGLSEEGAVACYGSEAIEVYHACYKPLEYSLPQTNYDQCYIKVMCMRAEPNTVVGIHLTGPNSGEVMQGFAVAMRCNLTLPVLLNAVGIHPTVAEELVKLHITKRSGLDPTVSGC